MIDVAEAAGVSIATVSAFLNGTTNVSPELTQRIEKAIREIGYERNSIARSLKIGSTRTIGLSYKQPIHEGTLPIKVELGGTGTLRGRSFDARRFRYIRARTAGPEVFRRPPGELFTPDNVGPALELEEWTRPTDVYAAKYDVVGGYFMADVSPHERVRVVLGERVEKSLQSIDSFDPFAAHTDSGSTPSEAAIATRSARASRSG